MQEPQPQPSSYSFPSDPTELAHWRRSGRYVPRHLPTLAPMPTAPASFGSQVGATTHRRFSRFLGLRYSQRFLQLAVSPSGLFSTSVLLLGLGLAPDLTALWTPAANAQTNDEANPADAAQGEADPSASASAPQTVDLTPSTAVSQLFRSAPVPQWSVFEDMLNGLSAGRPQAAVEVAAEPPQPDPGPSAEVTAGEDRRGENLERAELFSASMINANLFEGNFAGANLFAGSFSSANAFASGLQAANLYAAKFDEANLYESDLREANLFKTDLRNANLYRADLTGANLFGADLAGANLFGANLTGANVIKANVEEALLCNTTMPDGNLSNRDCPG